MRSRLPTKPTTTSSSPKAMPSCHLVNHGLPHHLTFYKLTGKYGSMRDKRKRRFETRKLWSNYLADAQQLQINDCIRERIINDIKNQKFKPAMFKKARAEVQGEVEQEFARFTASPAFLELIIFSFIKSFLLFIVQ